MRLAAILACVFFVVCSMFYSIGLCPSRAFAWHTHKSNNEKPAQGGFCVYGAVLRTFGSRKRKIRISCYCAAAAAAAAGVVRVLAVGLAHRSSPCPRVAVGARLAALTPVAAALACRLLGRHR